MNGMLMRVGKNVQLIPVILIICVVVVAFGSAAFLTPPAPEPKEPVAGFGYTPVINLVSGQTLTFDAASSTDSDGSIVGYQWDFGDGTSATGKVVTHAYEKEGTYTVTLVVVDNDGLSAECKKQVYIRALPPKIIRFKILPDPNAIGSGWENKWIVGKALTFDSSEFNYANGYTTNHQWNLGDGNIQTGTIISHIYREPGIYTVALTVVDLNGDTKTLQEQITILEKPTTTIYVDPIPSKYKIGDIITLNIMISDVTELWSWQAGMTFNPAVLECIPTNPPSNTQGNPPYTAFSEGEFLRQGGNTLWFVGSLDNNAGVIAAHGCNLANPATPVSGSGVLATVTFKVKGEGDLNIHLTNVILLRNAIEDIPVFVVN